MISHRTAREPDCRDAVKRELTGLLILVIETTCTTKGRLLVTGIGDSQHLCERKKTHITNTKWASLSSLSLQCDSPCLDILS